MSRRKIVVITGSQIRAARALLNWTAGDLSDRSGIGRQTLVRLEAADGFPNSRVQTLAELKRIFEEAGVEFIGTETEPGVILRRKDGR